LQFTLLEHVILSQVREWQAEIQVGRCVKCAACSYLSVT